MNLLRIVCSVVAALVIATASLVAQSQDGFKPLEGIATEGLPALPLLYTAYALVWLVLIGYLFLLWQRLGKVEKELREVSARLSTPRRS